VIETVSGTAFGFVVSVCIWEFVVKPGWGIHTAFVENLSITLLFTVASIIRGYVFRRFFNSLTHKNNKKEQHDQFDRDNGPR
jgi:hypothetical protein